MSWSLKLTNHELGSTIRWLWFLKTDPNRAWAGLNIQVHANSIALFSIAMESKVSNCNTTLFWSDKWIFGCSIADLAQVVVEAVPARVRHNHIVAEAMINQNWAVDVQGNLTLVGLFEYFQLWDTIHELAFSQEEGRHLWRLDPSWNYSSKSAYWAFFNGATTFKPWKQLWKTLAPPKCKILLWLAIRNRC